MELEVQVFEQHATSPCLQAAQSEDANSDRSWVGNCSCTCLCPTPP